MDAGVPGLSRKYRGALRESPQCWIVRKVGRLGGHGTIIVPFAFFAFAVVSSFFSHSVDLFYLLLLLLSVMYIFIDGELARDW